MASIMDPSSSWIMEGRGGEDDNDNGRSSRREILVVVVVVLVDVMVLAREWLLSEDMLGRE